MNTKTWAYGTRYKAKIKEVVREGGQEAVLLVDERGEGHIIFNGDHSAVPRVDADAVIEFTRGGPTGGYWKIVEVTPPT